MTNPLNIPPDAMPDAVVTVAVVLATVSVVVTEFVAGRIGLGAAMMAGYAQLDTPLVFGALAFIWPERTIAVLVYLFGAYVLVDGVAHEHGRSHSCRGIGPGRLGLRCVGRMGDAGPSA
jgi:hypothetical protein